MSKLSEYYINSCKQHADSDKLFIKWNWGAFLFGSIWLVYRGMFLYTLIYLLIASLEVGVNYLMVDYFFGIAAFAMHILLGLYGTSLFCKKYKADVLDQLNKSKIYLDCSGKKQQINPSAAFIREALLSLKNKPDQFLILKNGREFIQTTLSETKDHEKFFHVEYLDSSKNILFESKSLQTLEQTLNLFKLFLFEDKSLKLATDWIDSDIEISKDASSANEVNIKTRPILAILFNIFLVIQALMIEIPRLNKFALNYNDIWFDNPSFRLIEKKLKDLKQGDEEFVVLEEGSVFMQTYLSNITDGARYYHVEYKLDNTSIINVAKDDLTEPQVIQLFSKFYKHDQSFVTDIIWHKEELPAVKTP